MELTFWVDGWQAMLIELVRGHVTGADWGVVWCMWGRNKVWVRQIRRVNVVARGQSRRVTRRVTFRMRCDHNPPHACVVLKNLKIQTSTDIKPNNSQAHRLSDVSHQCPAWQIAQPVSGSNVPAVTRQPQTFSATLNKGQECKSKQGFRIEWLSSTFHWRNVCMEDAYRNQICWYSSHGRNQLTDLNF